MTMITFLCSIYFKIRSISATTLCVSFYHNDMQLKITKIIKQQKKKKKKTTTTTKKKTKNKTTTKKKKQKKKKNK